jgi:hypothetical protein
VLRVTAWDRECSPSAALETTLWAMGNFMVVGLAKRCDRGPLAVRQDEDKTKHTFNGA